MRLAKPVLEEASCARETREAPQRLVFLARLFCFPIPQCGPSKSPVAPYESGGFRRRQSLVSLSFDKFFIDFVISFFKCEISAARKASVRC
jgi:hypothetical protein